MITIKDLYKESNGVYINNISLDLQKGDLGSLECSLDISNIFFDLIIGKDLPGKGLININNIKNSEFIRAYPNELGVVFGEEGYYESHTIEDYLKFFSKVLSTKEDYKDIMMKLGLLDIGTTKIKHLTSQQKKRLSFARERLKDLKLFLFQEPLANLDTDSVRIILENIQELRDKGVTFFCTCASYKDILLLGGRAFSIDRNGIEEMDIENNSTPVNTDLYSPLPVFKIEKIPAKLEDKIMLFDPIEIDYIESEHGVSNLSIRGEKFPCSQTLTELEEKLKHFGFFRCHRSYLVNLQRVREVVTWTRNSYSLNLDDKQKTSIPLSKGRLDALKIILNL